MATTVAIRVDARRKQRAEKFIRKLGLTTEEAVNAFFVRIEKSKGLSFAIDAAPPPKAETVAFWDKLYNDDYAR